MIEPAFPIVLTLAHEVHYGLTIRDYFAAKAMQAMLSFPGDERRGNHYNNNTPEGVAEMAYNYADAMLAEREKRHGD